MSDKNNEHIENNNDNNYEFVTETIKKKPINKKRFLLKTIYSILLGILAGAVACVIFAIFAPKLYNRFNPDEPELVFIPEDEQIVESAETGEETTSKQENDEVDIETLEEKENSEENIKVEGENVADDSSNKEETDTEKVVKEEDKEDSAEATDESNEESDNKIHIVEKEELTLSDYKKFYLELNNVANAARKSLTTVTGTTNGTDWFNNSYETDNVSTGLIIADNGKELLIITNSYKLEKAKDIEVTFCDDKSYKGTIKKADSATGLVVVAVELNAIDETTKDSYKNAELGNSTVPTLVGTPIIAIGSPLGIENSMAVGAVTSNTRDISQADANIRYITTDIYGSTEGSGIIIDLDGKVLGIIFQGGTTSDTKNLIHAYSISDIKSKIEKLLNGQDMAYLGIIGMDVTKAAMEELSVPEGAYVKQVVVDSPAMKGGIQNGDVIVKLGTTDIRSFRDYKVAISKCQPGDMAMVTVKRLGKDGYVEFSYEIYLEALQ